MNERIRELAEQALFESDFDDEQNIKITMDIFAELIVRECVGIVADAVDHREPASTYVDKINQHFGVEQ
jgi:hypothetical protein